jgi:LmbE family N-acetylglucosaminyl deacetylase
MENQKVLMVVGAHPDDPEFGAGGTVAKYVKEGWKAVYVVCTNGDKGTQDPAMTSEKLAIIREQEQKNAAAVLGVSAVEFLP